MDSLTLDIQKLHPSFKLNKKNFTEQTLISYAENIVEKGEPHNILIGQFVLDWLNSNPYVHIQTSGSTGNPQVIKVLKIQMINSAKATGAFFKMLEGSKALLCLSANYIAGKMMLVRAMVLGWKLDVVPPKMNPLDDVFKHYDFCAMVPLQLDNSIARLHLIKKIIIGGAAIPRHLVNLVQNVKTKVYETYGMTETVSHIAIRRVNSKKSTFEESYFKALPKVTLAIDKRDCLIINALSVSKEKVITNDIVELLSHKKFKWKGRIDNVINSGGVKLFPEEIEHKLQTLFNNRFFISWLPDTILGQQLILIIEDPFKKLEVSITSKQVKQLTTLEKYEVPKKVFILEKFEETASGKVHRETNRLRVL